MLGRISTSIYRSPDSGMTWTARGTSAASLIGIIPTPDGEVVAVSGVGLYRSTGWANGNPTWSTKATPNGASQFQPWSLVGNGQKLLTTEYAAGAGFPDSRYARMSLDGGVTWTVAYDSGGKHGVTLANASPCTAQPTTNRLTGSTSAKATAASRVCTSARMTGRHGTGPPAWAYSTRHRLS